EELAVLVNAVVRAYLDEVVNHDQVARGARLKTLADLRSQHEDRLRARRRTLREIAEAAPELSPFEREVLVQDLLDCKRELRRVRLAKAAAQARPAKDAAPADLAAL